VQRDGGHYGPAQVVVIVATVVVVVVFVVAATIIGALGVLPKMLRLVSRVIGVLLCYLELWLWLLQKLLALLLMGLLLILLMPIRRQLRLRDRFSGCCCWSSYLGPGPGLH